ncbi:hypothetical protein EV148_10289 [Dokdonella fugitiva]|jgi:hypothetical protein|uniref:Uncharacterized protein n=2 Tax=Dokdonella fugitiva TaxID=328517 RepID=A0A4R2ID93_9GAMM|nr:hypothetical protein [Dokdonella fugitiva]TCO41739.1 hypothetical protein EV148_10289 [Dokdonella fugitiva]
MRPAVGTRVPQFQFRLARGLSIGPAALKHLWSVASGCEDVTVSREPTNANEERSGHRYSLWAPPHRFDLAIVEDRLRATLEARFPKGGVTLFRLDGVPRAK